MIETEGQIKTYPGDGLVEGKADYRSSCRVVSVA